MIWGVMVAIPEIVYVHELPVQHPGGTDGASVLVDVKHVLRPAILIDLLIHCLYYANKFLTSAPRWKTTIFRFKRFCCMTKK